MDGIVDAEIDALTLDSGGGRRVIEAAKAERYRALTKAGKVLLAYKVVKYGQEVMDALLDQRPSIANGVDLALDLTPPKPVVTFDGYGPIQLGTTEDAALKASPVHLSLEQGEGPCRTYRDTSGGDNLSQHLEITVDAHTGDLIGIGPPAGARTDRGLHIGSTAAQVQSAYRDRPVTPVYSQAGHVLLVRGRDTHHVIGFGLGEEGSTVQYISVGTADFASGFEICI
jgi:hypothetical protein